METKTKIRDIKIFEVTKTFLQLSEHGVFPVGCLLGFSLLASLSLYFPELPGNGKGPMQLALSDGLPLSMVAVLLVLKRVVILAVLRGGAEGGLLTPGLAVGGLVSLLLCALWQLGFPGGDKSSFAVVGAAAFLAASMQIPPTAGALVMELTHLYPSYLAPALLCAAGAFLTCLGLDQKEAQRAAVYGRVGRVYSVIKISHVFP